MDNLSDYLKYSLCGVLCVVSMILTACFALSFGSTTGSDDSQFMQIASPVILITIGVVLDLSKYIFWGASGKEKKGVFTFLAVVLMTFSWMASVAFFVSSEDKKVTDFRKETAEYTGFQTEVEFLKSTIEQKTLQSKKRLDSKFHDQWDKSEALTSDIEALSNRLKVLIKKEPSIGLEEARDSVVSIAFFHSISEVTGSNAIVVRNMFYGLLALLIEVCAFGLISLCGRKVELNSPITAHNSFVEDPALAEHITIEGNDSGKDTPSMHDEENVILDPIDDDLVAPPSPALHSGKSLTKEKIYKYSSEELRLINDIKSEEVPPVFRRIKELNYDITQTRIREILQELKIQGVLVQGARNSLVLAQKPFVVVSS